MTGRKVSLSVPGEPKGKGRPRAVPGQAPNGELFVRMVTPRETRDEEARVRRAFKARYPDHKPWTGPVMLRFTAVFQTPRSFNRALRDAAARGELYAIKKPDKDNVEKLIIDALNGVAFVDDQQVMGGGIKRYGSPARIEFSLERLDSPDVPETPGQRRAERAQAELPLSAGRHASTSPTKSGKRDPVSARPSPDLSEWNPRQRALIEAAMAREERGRRK